MSCWKSKIILLTMLNEIKFIHISKPKKNNKLKQYESFYFLFFGYKKWAKPRKKRVLLYLDMKEIIILSITFFACVICFN